MSMEKRYKKNKKGLEEVIFDMGFKKIKIVVYPSEGEKCMYIKNTDKPPKGNYIMMHVDGVSEVFEMIDLDAVLEKEIDNDGRSNV